MRRLALFIVPAAVALGAAGALAYFSVSGSGNATAGIGGLSAPTISSATPGPGTVVLAWSAVTPPGSGAVSYYVSRDGGAAGGDCPGAASPTSVFACIDAGLGVGTHHYTVTAVWRSWTATSTQATATLTQAIVLGASSGHVGDTVSISGTLFHVATPVSATYDGSSVTLSPATTTGGSGAFSGASFTVPTSAAGPHTVEVTVDGQVADATFTVTPMITASPGSGNVGDSVTISGTGFAASSSASVSYDGAAQVTSPASPVTGTTGSFSATFTVPAAVAGSHTVSAADGKANSASATQTVTPKISLGPSSAHVGDTVTITGSGFGGSLSLSATYGGSGLSLSPLTPTTSSTGGFSATFVVPAGAAGARAVAATDSSSNTGSSTFTLTPQVTFSGGSVGAASGYVGDTITVTGAGFAASSGIGTHTYGGSAIVLTPTTPTTTSSGGFSATFAVPASTAGSHSVSFADSASNTGSGPFTVNPWIALSPSSAAAGSADAIAGTGFAGSSGLSATFNSGTSLSLGGTTSTDANGSFTGATYTVPSIGSGIYAVRATDGSSSSATASFTLTGSVTSRATANWNVATTWTGSARTGTITTSSSSTAVTGSGTRFTTELQTGDAVYKTDGTTLIGTVASIASDTSLTLAANAASAGSGIAYTAGRVPSAQDGVTIADGFLVTIPSGVAAVARSVTVTPLANSAELKLSASSSSLTVGGAFVLNRPTGSSNAVLNVGPGTATLGGNLAYVGTATTSTRCIGVIVTTGTLSVGGNLTMDNQGTSNACATKAPVPSADTPAAMDDLNLGGGAATLNLAGALTLSNPANTTASLESTTSSVIDFNGTSSQTIAVPGSPLWRYGGITVANTSPGGVTLGGALTGANFGGDLVIVNGGTLNASSYTASLGGNFTNNGTFNAGTSMIGFAGSGAQSIGGSSSTTFANLSVNSTGTVTLTTSASVSGDLTVSGGVFDVGSNAVNRTSAGGTLTVDAAGTLKIGGTNGFPSNYATHSLDPAGTVNYSGSNQSISNESYGNLTLSGSGTKTAAGGLVVVSNVTIGSGTTLDPGGNTISVAGNWTDNGSFAAGGTANFNGSGAQTIGGSSTTTFNNVTVNAASVSLAASQSVAGSLSVNAGTLDLSSFNLDRASSGGTLTIAAGATLKIGGSSTTFPVNYVTHSLDPASTVNYTGAAQAVSNESYGNLALSGSGTVTMPAGSLTVAGTFTTSGTLSARLQAGLTVGGGVTIGSGTTVTTGAFTDSFAGNFTDNGTFTATGSTVMLNGTGAQAIAGSTATSFASLTLYNSAAAVTAATNFSVSGTFTVSAGAVFTPAAALVLNSAGAAGTVTGSGTVQVTRTLATADYSSQYKFAINTLANLTVEYSAAAAQTISALTYGSLKTSGSGTKTAAGALTVGGDLTIGSSTSFNTGNGFTDSIAGNFTNNGTFTNGGASSALTVNGTGAQMIGGSGTGNLNIVTINKSSGTATLAANETIGSGAGFTGTLAVTAGTLDLSTFTFNRSATGGTLTVSAGATLRLGGGSGGQTSSNFPLNFTTVSLGSTSTVEYSATGAAQTVYATPTYGNLVVSGTTTKTSGGALTIAGSLTINAGATFGGGSGTVNVAGGFTNTGTFTAGTGTIGLNGSGGQTVSGATTFNNLTVADSAGVTLAANETVSTTLTLTFGVVSTGSNSLIVAAGGTVTRTSGLINGFEQRSFSTGSGQSATFDVGTNSTYSPISVASLNVTTAGSLTASASASQQSSYGTSTLSAGQYVNRYWTLTPAGGLVVAAYNATGTFVAGDLVGSPNTTNLALYRYSVGAWTPPATWSATATTATGTGFGTAFGDFASGIPPAAELLFTTPPATAAAGFAFLTQPKVTVADAMGHTVTTDSSTVVLAITGGTPTSGGPGTLSGCTQSGETGGMISFTGCSIDTVGTGYQLHATDGGLTGADSSAFAVNQFAITPLGTASTLTSGASSSFNTANTYAATSGSVLLVIVSANVSTRVPTLSVSGGPTTGTFTALPTSAVTTKQTGNDASVVQAFWVLGTGSTAAFIVTGNAAISDAVVQVVQILGAKTTAPIAATAVTATGTASTASVTFAAPASGDAQILAIGSTVKNSVTTFTAPAGFTELQDTSSTAATNGQSADASYRTSAASGSAATTLSQSANWGAIGIEIAHS